MPVIGLKRRPNTSAGSMEYLPIESAKTVEMKSSMIRKVSKLLYRVAGIIYKENELF
jgi:hypothetical protein